MTMNGTNHCFRFSGFFCQFEVKVIWPRVFHRVESLYKYTLQVFRLKVELNLCASVLAALKCNKSATWSDFSELNSISANSSKTMAFRSFMVSNPPKFSLAFWNEAIAMKKYLKLSSEPLFMLTLLLVVCLITH